jgi:hypothetical protein
MICQPLVAQITGITTLNHTPFSCQIQNRIVWDDITLMTVQHRSQVCHLTTTPINHHYCSTIITLGPHMVIFRKRTIITGTGNSQNDYNSLTTFSQKLSFQNTVSQDEEFWTNMGKMTLWDMTRPTLLYTVYMGNFWVPEEMNNTCRRKTYMEWQINVPPYKFILHVTSLLTQKANTLSFTFPFSTRLSYLETLFTF